MWINDQKQSLLRSVEIKKVTNYNDKFRIYRGPARQVTAAFFKKLGEKLRNYQRYQKPMQLSESSSFRSSSLDLNSNIKCSVELTESQNAENDLPKQILDKKTKYKEKERQIQCDNGRNRNGKTTKLDDNVKMTNQDKLEDKELIQEKKKKRYGKYYHFSNLANFCQANMA
ncbi:hypothetical protein LOAG_08784 [Loa loa]|uniref:Uncharacterized protein n=1 Tax=Loa loa TaxID=7209 RepID=A0A1S0TT53_LOALO|nr:hypothetical protein LOAG_08784 [Loa loa]EFO19709.1 hypothetical protein LOAG_08784 [Loa loa]